MEIYQWSINTGFGNLKYTVELLFAVVFEKRYKRLQIKGFALIGSADYPNHRREIQRGKRGISEAILRTALRNIVQLFVKNYKQNEGKVYALYAEVQSQKPRLRLSDTTRNLPLPVVAACSK